MLCLQVSAKLVLGHSNEGLWLVLSVHIMRSYIEFDPSLRTIASHVQGCSSTTAAHSQKALA